MRDDEQNDRRHVRRRSLPFPRSGVLRVGEREHIVTVIDLSPEGAFLASRVPLDLDAPLLLRMVLPRGGQPVSLPCEVVWRNERFDAASGRPAGVAVRFTNVEIEMKRHLDRFAHRIGLPAARASIHERFEYRLAEHAQLGLDELNRLGQDGWALVSTLPGEGCLRLVLMRRRP